MPRTLIQTAAQTAIPLDVQGRLLLATHEQITTILNNRLSSAHGALLAKPIVDEAGSVQWSTPLKGEITPAASLREEDRTLLRRRSEALLNEIGVLAGKLRGESASGAMVGQMLERAAVVPAGDWLYSVGGQPVIVMWGHSDNPLPPEPVASPQRGIGALPAGMPLPVTPVHPGTDSTESPTTGPPRKRRWRIALLTGLLAIALLALLGLRGCTSGVDATGEPNAKAAAEIKTQEKGTAPCDAQAPQFECERPPAPPASEPPQPEPPPEPEPPALDPLADLMRQIESAGRNCEALQALFKDQALSNEGAEVSELRDDITNRLQEHCRETLIREAKNMCPGQRPRELAPELALVLDASGSMGHGMVTIREEALADPAALLQEMLRQLGGADTTPPQQSVGNTRMTAARRAAISMVQRAPSDANIGLVRVEGRTCSAHNSGFYPPSRRGQLIRELQVIQPHGGTPLSDGVAKGGQMVDGVSREALMVVISDGAESCGGDPCAVARRLKQAKPYLKINVVDITGTGAANCLAQVTGGKVFTAHNADEVATMTREASQEAMAPAECSQ